MKPRRSNCVSNFAFIPVLLLGFASELTAESIEIVWSRTNHAGVVNSIEFSRDGNLLASGGNDGTVRIWSAADGTPVQTITNQGTAVLCTTFPTNGVVSVYGADQVLRLWRVTDASLVGTQVLPSLDRPQWPPPGNLAFSRDGTLLAHGPSDGKVSLRRTADGTFLTDYYIDPIPGSPGDELFVPLDFSPDGRYLAVGETALEHSYIAVIRLQDSQVINLVHIIYPMVGAGRFSVDSNQKRGQS